jgi:hypothetical protein
VVVVVVTGGLVVVVVGGGLVVVVVLGGTVVVVVGGGADVVVVDGGAVVVVEVVGGAVVVVVGGAVVVVVLGGAVVVVVVPFPLYVEPWSCASNGSPELAAFDTPLVHCTHVSGVPWAKPINDHGPLYVLSLKWLFWWLLMCVGTTHPVKGLYVPYSEKMPL